MQNRRYAPGESVFREGDKPAFLYRVISGHIKLMRSSSNGRDVITELIFPGGYFDLPSLVDGEPYAVSAQSLSSCSAEVELYAPADLRDVALLSRAQGDCLRRLRYRREMLAAIAADRVEHRICLAFKMLAENQSSEVCERSVKMPFPLSRQELAELVGSTTETAIRCLSDLRQRGLLEETGHHMVCARELLGELLDLAS